MSAPEMRKPYAFLSSPVRGLEELRQAVHDLELPDARTVWVDEINRGRPAGELSFLTIEHLFRIIREADVFLVLLGTQSHGTGIEVGSENAHASYWEAELFYAVLLGKKVQVFEIDGFHPRPKLARLLTMFRRALPPAAWSGPHPGSQVAAAIHRFLLAQIDRPAEQPRRRNRLLELLVDGFFDLRGADGGGGRAEEESLRFLDGSFADGTVSPNEAIISRMLSEVRTVSNEEGRLARLWIAYRELSGAPPDSRGSLDLLPHWNRFFGEWASAGSWYGLHGHPHLAVLPALVEQAKVRERMRRLGSSEWKDANISYPGGALASSRYSIAGRSGSLRKRRLLLRGALADLDRSLAEKNRDPTGLLAIRGSIRRRLGAFGAAIDDYERVLRWRLQNGASESAIGEALAELGFAYLFQLRFWKGRALLEDGVRMLSSSGRRPGFLIRAQRKLALAYALTGKRTEAQSLKASARKLAQRHGVMDQLR